MVQWSNDSTLVMLISATFPVQGCWHQFIVDSLFPSYLIQVRFLGLSEFQMSKCNLPADCIVKTHINIYKYIIK